MNHLIVIPTKFEAAMVSLKPSDSISLLVSGFGKGCLRSLKTILKKEPIKNITLIGMAGNLAPEDRLGHTYIIKSVTDKNDIIDLTPPSKKKIPFSYDGYASLITVSRPVYTETRKRDLSNYADLVDMEGFHVAKLCKENSLGLVVIRVVSDNCNMNLEKFFCNKLGINELPVQFSIAQKKIAEVVDTIVKQQYGQIQR